MRKQKLASLFVATAGLCLLAGLHPIVSHAQQEQWDFPYKGYVQSFQAPSTGTYKLQVWGAEGGSGGKGGYSEGEVNLTAGQSLYVYVGGAGSYQSSWGSMQGGWNGGGAIGETSGDAGSGGGASDIRTHSDGNWLDYLGNRIIVAGGGGGKGWTNGTGGAGGGTNGANGTYSTEAVGGDNWAIGLGGSQSSGGGYSGATTNWYGYPTDGSLGQGGNGQGFSGGGGAGGGGYYGGGGGQISGGGGGSGYIGGVSSGQSIAGNQWMPSPDGGNEVGQYGNGYAIITMEYSPPTLSVTENTTSKATSVTLTATASENTPNSIKDIILPDGSRVYATSAQYTVSTNGTYTFTVEDNYGNQIQKSITVNNIIPPNNDVPDLISVSNKGNSALVQWGVSMPQQNILYQTSFEPNQLRPSLYGGGNQSVGDQSFSTDTASSGSWSMKLSDNIDGTTGNAWWYPSTSSTWSANYWRGMSIPNGANLSVTFKVKAVGGNTSAVHVYNGAPWGKAGVPLYAPNGSPVYYAQTVNWNYPPNSFRVYSPSGKINWANGTDFELVTSRNQDHDYGQMWYKWDASKQEFVRDPNNTTPWTGSSPLGTPYYVTNDTFNYGEPVLQNYWATIDFGQVNVPIDGQWHTVSFNAKASNSNYDFQKDGFDMRWEWTTNGNIYIDDVTVGYATKVNIYRNGQLIPLTEAQSYLSSFDDTGAIDKAPPSTPNNVHGTVSGQGIHLTWNASTDYGTNYTYQVSSVDSNGTESALSPAKTVTVTSGVAEYDIYSNGNLVGSTSGTSYDVPLADGQNVSIVAVDGAGNRSGQSDVPNLSISEGTTSWTNRNVVLNATASDNHGLYGIELPNGSWVQNSTAGYAVSGDGAYTFVARNNQGNETSDTISVSNIDTSAPTAPSIQNSTSWTNASSVSVRISPGTDSQSGINRVEYSLSGATNQGWTTYSQPFSVTNEGVTTVSAREIDNAGNVSSTTTSNVRIDRTPPDNTSITIQLKN